MNPTLRGASFVRAFNNGYGLIAGGLGALAHGGGKALSVPGSLRVF